MKNIPVHKSIIFIQNYTQNLTESIDIANVLGRKFEKNSKNSSLDPHFLEKKKIMKITIYLKHRKRSHP
jgi:hypothetical protein